MSTKEIIESGLLELYAIGAATPEETAMIDRMLKDDLLLREELERIHETLENYASANAKHPPVNLLRNIFDAIAQNESDLHNLPPLLSPTSTIEEWKQYLTGHHIENPDPHLQLNMQELTNTSSLVTYIVWAKNGAWVEETHHNELERLFMLQGNCSIEINGETHHYQPGDFIEILPGTTHRAEVTGSEVMILVGQRVAA